MIPRLLGEPRRGDDGPPWRLRDLAMSLALVLCLVGFYAFAERLDDRADLELEQLARAERARIGTQAALPPKVREAYSGDLAAEERRCVSRRDGREYCYRSGDPR